MGYIAHNFIIVTSWSSDALTAAHAEASRIFPCVSPISPATINNYQSFFIPPDGSKEGWAESDDGDARRCMFREWLHGQQYDDGSCSLTWCEVRLGEDYDDRCLVDCDHPRKGTETYKDWRKSKLARALKKAAE
jgi:hypothetical protein